MKPRTSVLPPPRLQWRKILLEAFCAVLCDLSGARREVRVTRQVEPVIPGVRNGTGFTGNKKKNYSIPFYFTFYSQAGISQTKPGTSVAARREKLRAVLSLSALTSQ